MQIVPWLFCIATALWFGFLARRAHRGVIAWAVAGGLFGLVASTFVMGVNHAVFIPKSERDYMIFRIEEFVTTALIIGVVGWLLTAGLHHQPVRLCRAIKQKFDKPQNTKR